MSSQQLFTQTTTRQPVSALAIMFTGILTLVAVMGIGRFALTPQIPLMIRDGQLSLSSAGVLAAMNYVGYLLGAIYVSRLRQHHALYLKTGLAMTVAVTIASGATSSFVLQCLFRFLAGLGGAWALIIVTSWTQLMLAERQAPRLSALVFAGPGLGITLSGLLAWSMAGFSASSAWYIYGGVALVAAMGIWRTLPAAVATPVASAPKAKIGNNLKVLLAVYSLAGFGYILPATFLAQMAHSQFPAGSPLVSLFWPLFGLSAVAGVLLAVFVAGKYSPRYCLAVALILQGIGVAASVVLPNTAGLVISTLLTGLGFLAIMQFSMRLARLFSTGSLARTVGMLTSGYASGQLIGPLISAASVALLGSLAPAILLAAAMLVLAGLAVIGLMREQA